MLFLVYFVYWLSRMARGCCSSAFLMPLQTRTFQRMRARWKMFSTERPIPEFHTKVSRPITLILVPHAPRLQFHSSRLKKREVAEQFKKRVEALSQEKKTDMDLLLSKLNDKSLPVVEFADAANHITVTILHHAGEEILSIASTETKHPRSTQAGHHSSTDPAEANCQRRIQALKDQLRQASAPTPQSTLDDIAAQLRRERQNLDELRMQKRNYKFLQATGAAQSQAQDPKTPNRSMWDYLKRYKNDHVQSSLPKEVNGNASRDPCIWKLGPLSLDPLT